MNDHTEEMSEGVEYQAEPSGFNTGNAVKSDEGTDVIDIATASAAEEKETERAEIQSQIEAYLASGGAIHQIGTDVLADPPKKPTSNYGGQPI